MRDLYDKLLKVLNLEQNKGFSDSAVIGGLEGFLAFWLSEARARAASDSRARQRVEEVAERLYGYSTMTPDTRQEQVLYFMERLAGGDQSSRREPQAQPEKQVAAPSNEKTAAPAASPAKSRSPREENREPDAASQTRSPDAAVEQIPSETPAPVKAPAQQSRGQGEFRREPAPQRNTMSREPAPSRQAGPKEPSRDRRGERRGQDEGSWQAQEERKAQWKRPSNSARVLPPEEALRFDRDLDRSVTTLPGIGSVKAARLERLGIRTVRDLLYHAPFRYEDYTTLKSIAELMYGDEVTIAGVVQSADAYKSPRGAIVITAVVGDGTGTIQAKWFGNRYMMDQLRPGTMLRLSGKVDAYMGRLQLNSPRMELIDEEEVRGGRLVPIYPRTEGVTEKALSRDISTALEQVAGRIPEPLPRQIRERFDLIDLPLAIRWLHQAENLDQARAARHRLAFDELLRLQVGMLQQRQQWSDRPGHPIVPDNEVLARFHSTLPFALTGAQQRAIEEILADMATPRAMSRLLQGDVGSGKTVVAATALLAAVTAGFQGALMAPTEILAEQHYAGLSRFLNPEGPSLLGDRSVRVALLTGSMTASEKQATREQIVRGEVDVVIGTHALVQDEVEFANLGLAIVDEQHRFGVKQRGALRNHTPNGTPDVLVMSATPIPRSLALTLYGDLDLSIIDEIPAGRQPIVTRSITSHQRERAYTYIRRQVQEGRQAFVICPLVEESDKLEAKAAVEEYRYLQQEIFPDLKVGLLHGRMKGSEKEAEMLRFYRNETQILVSTAVVEVGIDVPNATVMLIEGANRFGLAQLHQFRGRVGRGEWRSLCLLMAEDELSSDGEQRLNALVENSDGFALAEEDLRMRGPGDFFGTRQSGLPEFKMAGLGDSITLTRAREAAQTILNADPELSQPQHQLIKEQAREYWSRKRGDLS